MTLQELRQKQADLKSRHEAMKNLQAARAAVLESEKNLQAARKAVKLEKQYIFQAEQDRTASRQALADATAALQAARKQMEQAAAVMASLQDPLNQQQAIVDQLTAESQAVVDELRDLNNRMDELTGEMDELYNTGSDLSEDRIAAVQRAVEDVGYDQNRLMEAVERADAYSYGVSDVAALEELKKTRTAEISAQAEQVSAQGTEASQRLDTINDRLREASVPLAKLKSAYDAARAERSAAEATAQSAAHWQEGARKWVGEADGRLREAKENEVKTRQWEEEAGKALVQSRDNVSNTASAVWNLGYDIVSTRTGFLYRGWHGRHAGHQAYVPISAYVAERLDKYPGETRVNPKDWPVGEKVHGLEIGVDTGHLLSDTGGGSGLDGTPGRFSDWMDTTLSLRYHNDNPVNSVRYGIAIVAPTGESRYYRDAYVPKGVGLFQDFGGGWQFQPEIEGVHHFTERDSITGKLIYNNRHSYHYSKEVPGAEVNPGDQTIARLAYDHIGDKHQLRTWLSYTYTDGSQEDGVVWNWRADRPVWQKGSLLHYRDGAAVEAGAAANFQLRPKDELGLYTTVGHAGATAGDFDVPAMNEGGILLSLRHKVTPEFSWQGFASWYAATVGYDPLYQVKNEGRWERYGLGLRLEWKASQVDHWSLDLERYVRTQKDSSNYNGYGVSFWYTHTF